MKTKTKHSAYKRQAASKQQAVRKREIKKRVGPARKHAPWSAALCHIDNESKIFWTSGHDSAIGEQGFHGSQVQGPWNPG
jgi:hypothetical protein